MDLIINTKDLIILINKYKDDIGKTKWAEQLMNLAMAFFTLSASDFKTTFGIRTQWIEYSYRIYIIILCIGCVKAMYKKIFKNITGEKLIKEISELDQTTHNHTILIIKDKYNKYSNRYLLYKEVTWRCKLFLNKKTLPNKLDNEKEIISFISNKLHVNKEYIKPEYKITHTHTKYSRKDKVKKNYRHDFYEINILQYPDIMKNETFEIDKVKYQWMTLDQMYSDKIIRKYNADIVNYVEAIYE